MARKLLIIPFIVVLLFGIPTMSNAYHAIEVIDADFQGITLSVKASTLYVSGAEGETLRIYNVAGVCVMSIRIDGQDRHYDLNLPKGCYIVKVGKTFVRKVFIK